MRTAEIFGTSAPIPLCVGPVAQRQSRELPENSRIVELSSMAETLAEVCGKEERATKLPHRRMHSFTIEALRGFGTYKVAFSAGVGGEQLTETLLRIAISQRHDLYRFGFRFFFTENLCKAVATGSFGSFAHDTEKEEVILLGDFRPQPRDKLEVYHPSTVKTSRKAPETISEFHDMALQQILLLEAIYGKENGIEWRKAADFFLELYRDAPETFSVDFITDVWERMTVDYLESIKEGIRRMEPYLESGATKVALRKVALSPVKIQNNRVRTFWCDPKTWKIQSKRGYWQCAILPELERERDRNDSQVALTRYMARRKKDTSRLSAVGDVEPIDTVEQVSGARKPIPDRKYPAGRRMTRGERTMAMDNTPATVKGTPRCWDFKSHATCHREQNAPMRTKISTRKTCIGPFPVN